MKTIESDIIEFFETYKETGQSEFALDPVHFAGVSVFFNQKPSHVLFPYPDIDGVTVHIGKNE